MFFFKNIVAFDKGIHSDFGILMHWQVLACAGFVLIYLFSVVSNGKSHLTPQAP